MRTSKNTDTEVESIAVECPAAGGLLRLEDCISCPHHKEMQEEPREKTGRDGKVEKSDPRKLVVCLLPVKRRTYKIFKIIDKEN